MFDLGLGTGIFSRSPTFNNGTAIIQTSSRWETIDGSSLMGGRITFMGIKKDNTHFNLVNVYAPASKPNERPDFYEQLEILLRRFDKDTIIMGGDFNITLDEIDITGRRGVQRTGRHELQHLIRINRLTDCFRTLHPQAIETTHTNTDKKRASRLDRIYAPPHLSVQTSKHIHQTLKYTDHKGIFVVLGNTQGHNDRKHTYWKFNDSLLEDQPFTNSVKSLLNNHLIKAQTTPHIIPYFEALKSVIVHMAQEKSEKNSIKRRETTTILEHTLSDRNINAHPDFRHTPEYEIAKQTLNEIHNYTSKGAQLRSRLPTINDETPSKHYLTLENNIQGAREITQILDKDLNGLSDPEEITHAFEQFYKELYTKQDLDVDTQHQFLDYCKSLDDNDKDELDQHLSNDDIFVSIHNLNTNSSPGPDGLTSQFYLFFSEELLPYLNLVYSAIFFNNRLPKNHTNSFITLLPKDSGSLLYMKNYRPISLLNTEYKILTSALARKLSPFLSKLIHSDQTCSIKNRNILDHCHFIKDLIAYANNKQLHTCILSIDQAKAFDRVSHDWLKKVLIKCNLGNNFVRWFSILYKDAQSQLIINKHFSNPFKIERGVRQGDPLSPLLYILSLEPLLEKNKKG